MEEVQLNKQIFLLLFSIWLQIINIRLIITSSCYISTLCYLGSILFPVDWYLWYSIDRIFLLHKEKEAIASLNNYIKFSLDIEDQNIVFSDYFKKFIDGKFHKVYLAEIIQSSCPYCHSHNLKHNDHYTSNVRFITADASHPVSIRLKKQRVLCNNCLKRSMAQSNLVNK